MLELSCSCLFRGSFMSHTEFEFEVKCMSLEVIHACFSIINYYSIILLFQLKQFFFSCPVLVFIIIIVTIIIIIREMSALNA